MRIELRLNPHFILILILMLTITNNQLSAHNWLAASPIYYQSVCPASCNILSMAKELLWFQTWRQPLNLCSHPRFDWLWSGQRFLCNEGGDIGGGGGGVVGWWGGRTGFRLVRAGWRWGFRSHLCLTGVHWEGCLGSARLLGVFLDPALHSQPINTGAEPKCATEFQNHSWDNCFETQLALI